MKFRMLSKTGMGLGLLKRLAEEGHEVDFWTIDAKAERVYAGILPRTEHWEHLEEGTTLLIDSPGYGHLADKFRARGFQVFGGGRLNDSLEANPAFGLRLAQSARLRIVDEHTRGPKITVGAIYKDGMRLPNTLHLILTCERFMEGNKGVRTIMGCLARFWKNAEPKAYRFTLQKIEPLLRPFKYSGPLRCTCIINEKDKMPRFINWGCHLSFDADYALCEGLYEMFSDKPPIYDWLAAVRVSVPPYPYNTMVNENTPVTLEGPHIWPIDVKREDGLFTAGVNGVVCEVTGKDKSLSRLDRSVYGVLESVDVPDIQYRADVVSSLGKQVEKLKELKYV